MSVRTYVHNAGRGANDVIMRMTSMTIAGLVAPGNMAIARVASCVSNKIVLVDWPLVGGLLRSGVGGDGVPPSCSIPYRVRTLYTLTWHSNLPGGGGMIPRQFSVPIWHVNDESCQLPFVCIPQCS